MALLAHVAEVAIVDLVSDEPVRVRAQLATELRLRDELLLRREEQEQDRRIARERETRPLRERVHDEIEITRAGARALGLRAPRPLLEALAQTEEMLPWLDADAHLVAIVLIGDGEPVHGRAHEPAQDRVGFGEGLRVHVGRAWCRLPEAHSSVRLDSGRARSRAVPSTPGAHAEPRSRLGARGWSRASRPSCERSGWVCAPSNSRLTEATGSHFTPTSRSVRICLRAMFDAPVPGMRRSRDRHRPHGGSNLRALSCAGRWSSRHSPRAVQSRPRREVRCSEAFFANRRRSLELAGARLRRVSRGTHAS